LHHFERFCQFNVKHQHLVCQILFKYQASSAKEGVNAPCTHLKKTTAARRSSLIVSIHAGARPRSAESSTWCLAYRSAPAFGDYLDECVLFRFCMPCHVPSVTDTAVDAAAAVADAADKAIAAASAAMLLLLQAVLHDPFKCV
jgi:hypothetical protein